MATRKSAKKWDLKMLYGIILLFLWRTPRGEPWRRCLGYSIRRVRRSFISCVGHLTHVKRDVSDAGSMRWETPPVSSAMKVFDVGFFDWAVPERRRLLGVVACSVWEISSFELMIIFRSCLSPLGSLWERGWGDRVISANASWSLNFITRLNALFLHLVSSWELPAGP